MEEKEKKGRGLGRGLSELLGDARVKAAAAKKTQTEIQEQITTKAADHIDSLNEDEFETVTSDSEARKIQKDINQNTRQTDNIPSMDKIHPSSENQAFDDEFIDHTQEPLSVGNASLKEAFQDNTQINAQESVNTQEEFEAYENMQTDDTETAFESDIAEVEALFEHLESSDKKNHPENIIDKKLDADTDADTDTDADVTVQQDDIPLNTRKNISPQEINTQYDTSFIGQDKNNTPQDNIHYLPIETVYPNPDQPRKYFNENMLVELAQSISTYGVLQPIIVNETNQGFKIVGGERRWRAAQIAELTHIPAIIKNYNDADTLEVALIENIQRADLSAVDEAKAYFYLIRKYELTQNELAQKVGKSRSYIANMIRLLDLDDSVRHFLDRGELTIGHARALIGVKDATKWAKRIISEDMSVRRLEILLSQSNDKTNMQLPKARNNVKNSDIIALEADLKAALGVQVQINAHTPQKGNMVIRYENLEQLDEICRRLCSNWGNDM